MTEDPKLSLEILRYFTREDVSYPANIYVVELARGFPNFSSKVVEEHINLAISEGLLDARIEQVSANFGTLMVTSPIVGLTSAGRAYLRDAEVTKTSVALKWLGSQAQGIISGVTIGVITTLLIGWLTGIISF